MASVSSIAQMALEYYQRGWAPTPVRSRTKEAFLKNWPQIRLTEEEIRNYFSDGMNIGILLGEPSNWLTDVDIDNPSALVWAEVFLPPTAKFGRASKPSSHWLYFCEGSEPQKYTDIDGKCIIEIRSTGQQTIFPPSIHPSGEEIRWETDIEPVKISWNHLLRQVQKVYAGALLLKYYPAKGSRQDLIMDLAGALVHAEWGKQEVLQFIGTLCKYAKDEELHKRLDVAESTYEKYKQGKPITGWPSLREHLPEQVFERLMKVLKIPTEPPESQLKQLVVVNSLTPRIFTEILLQRHKFRWQGGREPLLRFDEAEGIWREDGEELIAYELRTSVKELPDEKKKRYVIEEIIADVKEVSWDPTPLPEPSLNLIPVANGVFDIETGELRPFRAEDYFTWKLPWRYNPSARSKLIIPILEDLLPPSEIITLYELQAYCLYRLYCFQKLFILYGRGSNGKGTFARILTKLLGKENVSNISLHDIQYNRFSASRLYRKLANISPELEYEDIKNTANLKKLTGEDLIEADRKFREPVKFYNYAKLIFLTNEVPRSLDTTDAYYRRLFLIEFPKQFTPNPKLDIEIEQADDEEYEALLYKVLQHLKRLYTNGFRFTRDKSLEEVRSLYCDLSSPLKLFVQEFCEITYSNDDFIFKRDFNEEFTNWLKEKGRTVYTERRLNNEMKELNIRSGQKGKDRLHAWIGIRWKTSSESHNTPHQQNNRRVPFIMPDGNVLGGEKK